MTPRPRLPLPRGLKLRLLYARGLITLFRRHPQAVRLNEIVADYPAWRRSQETDRNALDDERPWITFSATRLLETVVRPDSLVFEYGAGGSTLFFARRAAEVVSIEHDRDWSARVAAALQQRGLGNTHLLNIVPTPAGRPRPGDPANPDDYASLDETNLGLSFRDYAASIDAYPDQFFDIVLIDGRARPSCFVHALPKVKPTGWLLYDNTSRAYYLPVTRRAAAHFSRGLFAGPIPYQIDFDETTVFQRRPES